MTVVEILNRFGLPWWEALLRASWQGGLALAIVGLVVRWRPRLSPRIQCWLWRLAYLKLLTALFWGTPVTLAVLPPAPVTTVPAPTTFASGPVAPPVSILLGGQKTGGIGEIASGIAPLPAVALAPVGGLLALWLGMVCRQIGRTLVHWRAASRVYRACRPLQDPEMLARCVEQSERLGLRRTPRLLTWHEAHTPLLLGAWNPAIVLPEPILGTYNATDRQLMLAHELAHLRRRDLLWAWLPLLARTLFWFHPLVWFAQSELTVAQEMDCDAIALEITAAPIADYGNLLLRIASPGNHGAQSGLSVIGMAATFHTLKRRLSAMTTRTPLSRARLALFTSALPVLALAGIVPWRVAAQAQATLPMPTSPSTTLPARRADAHPAPSCCSSVEGAQPQTTSAQAAPASDSKPLEADAGKYKVFLDKIFWMDRGPNAYSPEIVVNGYHFKPNLSITLKVTAAQKSDLALLTGFSAQVLALDSAGKEAEKNPFTFPVPLRTVGAERSGILQLRMQNADVKKLHSLEGSLLIEEGKLHTFELAENDLKAGNEKKLGALTLKVNSFQAEGNMVQADFTLLMPTTPVDTPGAHDPQNITEITRQNARSVKIELRDSKGNVYRPMSTSVSPPVTPMPLNSSGTIPPPNDKPTALTNPGYNIRTTVQVPADAPSPKTLVLEITSHTGITQRIPFKFTEIPIP